MVAFYNRTYNKILFNEQIQKQRAIFVLKNQLVFPPEFFGRKDSRPKGLVHLPRNFLKIEPKGENYAFPASMTFQESF